MAEPVNLAAALQRVHDYWSPAVVSLFNGSKVQVVKVRGTFDWHQHADSDECFLVLQGRLTIELRAGVVSLAAGELFVVPRHAEHRPSAAGECQVLVLATDPAAPELREHARRRLRRELPPRSKVE